MRGGMLMILHCFIQEIFMESLKRLFLVLILVGIVVGLELEVLI